MESFPLPGSAPATLAAAAPGAGPQFWAGAPCAVLDADGTFVVGYRVRNGPDTTDQTVVARSADGERLEPVFTLDQDHFGAQWTERPALVRHAGGWRMYVRVWQAWICCHLLDVPGAEDRMNCAYATSTDGLAWDWHGTVLEGRAGEWDARGARLTTILPDGRAAYDGRATEAENWFERIGIAVPNGGRYAATGEPVFDARYLEALALPDGGYRIYYEARLPDETHELRTELLV